MKMRKIIIALACICSSIAMQAQTKVFDKLAKDKNISTVYISRTLLQMGASIDMGGIAGAKDLFTKLEQIEIYSTESKEGTSSLRAAMKAIDTSNYQVLLQVKEDGENITFYSQQDGDVFKDFVMYIDEDTQSSLIRLIGTFTADDIKKVIDSNDK